VPGCRQSNGIPILAAMACVLAIAASHCAAQTEPAFSTVSGVVKDSLTGQPIERALVDAQNDAMLTDSEGRFELRLQEGLASIQVRRPGYVVDRIGGMRTFPVSANMKPLTFYLVPMAGITGRVRVTNGGDADNVTFTAYRKRSMNGREQWMQAGAANTNGEGVFRIFDLDAPGSYVLCSRPSEDRQGQRGKAVFGYPSVCYPASPGDGAANMLNLGVGEQADVEISIARQPFYQVNMVEQNNPPGQGMQIQIHDRSGIPLGFPVQWNQDRQTARAQLPNGSYYAEARGRGNANWYARADFKVNDAPVSGVNLTLLPLAPVAVQIRKEFTASTEQAALIERGFVDEMNSGLNLQLVPVDSMDGGGGQPLQHVPGADSNRFEIPNVIPGRYWVAASYFLGGYVSAISSGGVDLTKDPLVVGPGSTTEAIEITLRNDTGEIDFTISAPPAGDQSAGEDRSELHGAAVYAIPTGTRGMNFPHAGAFPGGSGQLSNLAPGAYRVVALDTFQNLGAMDAQELAKLSDKGKTVTVAAGATVNVQLDVIKSSVEGQNP
jgi:hypothetical protein